MGTQALTGLRDYLTDTLSPDNMLWLATQLTEYAKKKEEFRPFTMDEIHARLAQSRNEALAGLSQDSEDMFLELEEEFAHEDKLEMAEAV